MIWLARKAFFGRVPFPVMHVDTGKKFPEMYAFRDRYSKEWGLDLLVEPCPPIDAVDPTLPPAARSAARKTEGLKLALAKHGFDGLFAGIRRDEEATRAKERVFSPRGAEGHWDVRDQPPEFWDHFNATPPHGAHLRVHPILHWTEIDIWRYTRRENIPIIPLLSRARRQALSLARRRRHHVSRSFQMPARSTKSSPSSTPPRFPNAPAAPWITSPKTRSSGCARPVISKPEKHRARHERHCPQSISDRAIPKTDRPLVRIVIVGSVDHGKSTLIGRLLHETGSLPDGKLEQLKAVSARRGMPFEWSFLLDALQTERDQGITIDTSQIQFHTKKKDFVLIDAPGHAEFLRNMITGAAQADGAILMVDATEGVREQTRRHGYLAALAGTGAGDRRHQQDGPHRL